jgi:hypothetical protein
MPWAGARLHAGCNAVSVVFHAERQFCDCQQVCVVARATQVLAQLLQAQRGRGVRLVARSLLKLRHYCGSAAGCAARRAPRPRARARRPAGA